MTSSGVFRRVGFAVAILVIAVGLAHAQTSTGTIVGSVRDASGAIVAGADIILVSQETGLERHYVSDETGRYAAAILAPGTYTLSARFNDRRSTSRTAIVMAGLATTVDLTMTVSGASETIAVTASSRPRGDHYHVGGWIDRALIAQQPTNGRSVFELTKMEPGVTAPARLPGGRIFIAPLGAGLNWIPRTGFTRTTVDGANIETPGTVGLLLQISPDAVEQVQVMTANFDQSAGFATSGIVNVISRSGENAYRGGAFSLYRDHRWSSYASNLPATPDPAFRREQFGATLGGPVRTNRAFVFGSYERHLERDLVDVRPLDPDLRPLGGTFISPYAGTLLTGRIDVRLSDRLRFFLRHTHDANAAEAVGDQSTLPSGWARNTVRTHQTLASLTSIVTAHAVNEVRVSSYGTHLGGGSVTAANCPAPCLGFGAPLIQLSSGSSPILSLGFASRVSMSAHRLQLSDDLAVQKRSHLFRLGFDWEHVDQSSFMLNSDPVTMTLWTPQAALQRDPSLVMPASLTTLDDLYKLPLRSVRISVGSGTVWQRGFDPVRRFDSFRVHAADQWSLNSALTVTAGIAWSSDRAVLNDDLTKPAWLAPLVGSDGLRVPGAFDNLSASAGFAWRIGGGDRTTIRGGFGRYVETMAKTVSANLTMERTELSPVGTGRFVRSNIVLASGTRLDFPQPTSFTGADLLAILQTIRDSLTQSLNPDNRDFSVLNLDKTKEGSNLYDPRYETPRALHASLGIERRFPHNLSVSLDGVWKRFSHTFINGIDYNRFLSARGPVIPACTAAQQTDVGAICTNGSLFFDTTTGRARYLGLLVRVDQRIGTRLRLLGAYALSSFVGSNGTGTGTTENPNDRVFGFNNDNWSENYGPLPTDFRHVLNVGGRVTAPWRLDISFNLAAYSRPPFAAYIGNVDFNGDGTLNDLLPGTAVNQFNRGLSRDDLARLVTAYNDTYAGKITAGGQKAPFVTLPSTYAFFDNFVALDLRVARDLRCGRSMRLSAFVDIFNVLDTKNLTGFNGNLAASTSFGQPTGRVGQAFGSGGPRAAQLGVRFSF